MLLHNYKWMTCHKPAVLYSEILTHLRGNVVCISDHGRAFEMLMKVVHIFAHPFIQKNECIKNNTNNSFSLLMVVHISA